LREVYQKLAAAQQQIENCTKAANQANCVEMMEQAITNLKEAKWQQQFCLDAIDLLFWKHDELTKG